MRLINAASRGWVLFPFLLPVFFLIHAWQHYFGLINPGEVVRLLITYWVVTALLFGGLWWITKNKLHAAFLCFMIMLPQFYWVDILDWLKEKTSESVIAKIPVFFILCVIAIFLLYRLFKKAKDETKNRVTFYLNLLFLIYIVVDCSILLKKNITSRQMLVSGAHPAALGAGTGWNLYFILFDEYAGSKSLLEDYGFDNSDIDHFLQARNFSLQSDSRSNYPQTFFSMASLLNVNYLEGLNTHVVKPVDYRNALKDIKKSSVVKAFVQHGYQFNNSTYFEVNDMPALSENAYLPSGSLIITAHTFYNTLVRDYLALLNLKPLRNVFNVNSYNDKMVARVIDQARAPKSKPLFLYCHLSVPHAPFYYGADGSLYPRDSVTYADYHDRTRHYLYNVMHANKLMQTLVDSIRKYDSNAAILLLSDHGYRVPSDTVNVVPNYRNFNAVYYPDHRYTQFYNTISNVNVFRVVMNKLLGANFALLPDSTVRLTEAK